MSKVDELIEDYQNTLDHMHICEHDDDECGADDASCRLSEIAAELKALNPRVSADVKWHNGKVTSSEGNLDSIRGDKVYIDTVLWIVEGSVSSLSSC